MPEVSAKGAPADKHPLDKVYKLFDTPAEQIAYCRGYTDGQEQLDHWVVENVITKRPAQTRELLALLGTTIADGLRREAAKLKWRRESRP